MATLTVQDVDADGLIPPTYAAAAGGGDEFANNGRVFFHIKNADASPMTVTFDSVLNCDQGQDHDRVVVIPATDEAMIGPFATNRYNDGSGLVQVTYTAVTTLTVAALKLSS